MHQLGDQWIELIDGVEHMVKAAEAINKWHVCNGCAFNNGTCNYKGDECPVQKGCYIKDLGVLNEDGLLPCPFCGEYPLVENAYEGVSGHNTPDGFWRISCFGKNHEMAFFSGNTRQQAIDAWNRRV